MRTWKLLFIVLLFVLPLLVTACNSGANSNQQQVQVTKGNLVIKVNGSGEVGVDTDVKPSFNAGGKVAKLNVKEGDRVTKGTVLAQMETNSLDLALSEAQLARAQAQVTLTEVQSARTQAEIALSSAKLNLDLVTEVSKIMDEITKYQWELKIAQMQADEARAYDDKYSSVYWLNKTAVAEVNVYKKQRDLAELLGKEQFTGKFLYLSGQTYDRTVVEDARIKQLQVTSAQEQVDLAVQKVEQAKRSLEKADKSVALAQKNLDDATITSRIDGTVVTVDVEVGDTVSSSGDPIYIVDYSTLRISAQIDEIDVAGVKIGQDVIIKLDSTPDAEYEGKVYSISQAPVTSTQNTGVVVYEVKIGFVNPPPSEVKLGMSTTVDILTNQRQDVMLIPGRAIKTDDKGNNSVDVLVNQKIETRQVQVGASDGINTEIVSGLNAGDTVIINRAGSTGMFGQ